MKLLDIINENQDENKLLKKANAVYAALKSGKIKYYNYGEDNEPIRLTIKLSDEKDIFITPEGDIWITPKKIKVREENKECMVMSAGKVEDIIKKKFEMFNIKLSFKNFNPREDLDTWLDREGALNEEDEDRILKKGMTVNKALRKGNLVIKYDHNGVEKNTKYRYELPERCNVIMRGESLRMTYRYDEGIKNIGDKFPLKIWTDVKGKEILLNTHMTNHDYDYIEDNMENTMLSYIFVKVMKNVKKRYEHFNIQLDLNPYRSTTPLFLNEEEKDNNLTNKDRKKAELIYKTFKTGKYKDDDSMVYRYILPDDYWTSNDDESGTIIIVLTMDPTQTLNLYAVFPRPDGKTYDHYVDKVHTSLYNDAKRKIKKKFEQFNVDIIF